jgi:Na+/H+ antiporter NhaD/arsenite permease-like protein
MLTDSILAGIAVAATVARPRSWSAALIAAAAAGAAACLGVGSPKGAATATAPMVAYLLAAVALAAAAVRLGLAARLAACLARAARGRAGGLFALVCLATAAATAAVSLDGAVVLLVPVALELARRFGAPLRPLLLGIVSVANAFSLGLPEGNPTNLVVLARAGTSLGGYAERALPAGVAAAALCAGGVAWLERRSLSGSPAAESPAPRAGGAASATLAVLRIGLQLTSLLVVLIPLESHLPAVRDAGGLPGALVLAAAAAAAAALVNNLPASAAIAAGLGGEAAYAALAGVSIGALATEHGSVATLLAGDLSGTRAYERRLVPVVAAALAVGTVLVWAGGR